VEHEEPHLTVKIIDLAVAEINLDIYLSWLQDVDGNPFIESARIDYSKSDLIEFLSNKLGRSDVKFWGIFTSVGKFIGTVKLDPIDLTQGTAWLGIMIGDTSERGKGLGLLVLEQVAQYARSHNLKELFLGVDKGNSPAIRLYEKSSFTIVSENEKSLIMRRILG
jgi:RimJ/RimL family protein N-acetyltransferase